MYLRSQAAGNLKDTAQEEGLPNSETHPQTVPLSLPRRPHPVPDAASQSLCHPAASPCPAHHPQPGPGSQGPSRPTGRNVVMSQTADGFCSPDRPRQPPPAAERDSPTAWQLPSHQRKQDTPHAHMHSGHRAPHTPPSWAEPVWFPGPIVPLHLLPPVHVLDHSFGKLPAQPLSL